MKCLVTGGAGFLGSHLCESLLEQGEDVICLDDFSSGIVHNLTDLISHRSFTLVEGDVTDPYLFEVDRIFNLACPASPPFYQSDPIRTTKTSVFGALNALELARQTGARVIQASTSEIYGDPLQHPQKENYWGNVNPIGPRSCYDEGKRVAESLMFDYHRVYGVDVRVVRIFNTYGPRMRSDDGRVVSNLIVQALHGQPLTIYGTGTQTRSFCYVDDLIRGLRAVAEDAASPGPYNLGTPHETTLMELAELVRRITGKEDLPVHFKPLPQDDPTKRQPDISRVSREVGWEPEISLEEGLQRTVSYFQEILDEG